MRVAICGDTIETGQLQFECTRAYKHKGRHRTQWRARNDKDKRMISVYWTSSINQKRKE